MAAVPFKKCRCAAKIVASSALCLVALVLMRYYGAPRYLLYEYADLSTEAPKPKFSSWYHQRDKLVGPRENWENTDEESEQFESEIQQDEARVVPGLGDGGRAVHQVGEANLYRMMKEQSEMKYAMNAYLSDRMPHVRNLTDYRHALCDKERYDEEFPSVSVVIVFRAQPFSVLLRTVWSVLSSLRRDQPWYRARDHDLKLGYPGQEASSPFVYLKELILVDDNSRLPELKGKLSHYVRTRLPPYLVRIVRPTTPSTISSVARARLAGARAARGDVLVFMEGHCEPQRDWLRPLLQRVKHRPHAVAAAVADVIEPATFEYRGKASDDIQVGGFTFGGENTWIQVSDREVARRGPCQITPTRSPVLQSGPFAVRRRWFFRMGGYDDRMTGWGADNLEFSFRMWMCGGSVEVVPCARAGLVYVRHCPRRLSMRYDFVGMNTARMAEVWMDDYKELFYLARPDLRGRIDVSARRATRRRLKCRSFGWYLQHVYPEKFVPVRDTFGYVRFYNKYTDRCLDTLQAEGALAPLGLHPCHEQLAPSQFIMLSLKGELRDEVRCADIHYSYSGSGVERYETDAKWRVVMMDCQYTASPARWRYTSGRLEHVDSGLCLDASGAPGEVRATRCRNDAAQKWRADELFSPQREMTKQQRASLERIRRAGVPTPRGSGDNVTLLP